MHWFWSIWPETLFGLRDNSDYAEFTILSKFFHRYWKIHFPPPSKSRITQEPRPSDFHDFLQSYRKTELAIGMPLYLKITLVTMSWHGASFVLFMKKSTIVLLCRPTIMKLIIAAFGEPLKSSIALDSHRMRYLQEYIVEYFWRIIFTIFTPS